MKQMSALLLAVLALAGCKHPLAIVGEGDVLSASGARDCLLEEFAAGEANCTDNLVVNGAYSETYTAAPRPGWQFSGWGPYCNNTTDPECSFNATEEWVAASEGLEMPALTAFFRREVNQGHNAVLMGHSFFDPIAALLPQRANEAGYSDHQDTTYYAGASGGAPINLWESDQSDAIKHSLDDEGLSLLGLTYYPMDYERNMQGYKNWISYALQANPEIDVFIGLSWGQNPSQSTAADFRDGWEQAHAGEFHQIVDDLRTAYPDTNIYCIPYGWAAIELKALFEAGQLPDVENLIGQENSTGVFGDEQGHAAGILLELSSLIWLKAIYGVDFEEVDYNSQFTTDLKALAEQILLAHDHNYDTE